MSLGKTRLLLSLPEFPVLFAGNILLGMAYAFVMPFNSVFGTEELGLSPGGFGLFMTGHALIGIVLSTWIARLSDVRFSRKSVLLVSSACGAGVYTAYAWLRDPWVLFAATCIPMAVSGVAFSQTFAFARDAMARRQVPAQDVPFYMNIFRLFYALAWTVGPAAGAWLLAHNGYRATYLAAAGLFCAFLAVIALGARGTPPSSGARAAAEAEPLRRVLRRPDLAAHFVAFILVMGSSTIYMMNLPLLILKSLGGEASHVGIAFSIAPVFELPLMYAVGVWATRTPSARIIRHAALLAVVYYAALALARQPWHVYPLQVLGAALVAVTNGLAITFFQDFLPGQAGTATNIYMNAWRIGSTAAFVAFGFLAETLGFRGVFAACAALCGAAWLIMLRWPPRPA